MTWSRPTINMSMTRNMSTSASFSSLSTPPSSPPALPVTSSLSANALVPIKASNSPWDRAKLSYMVLPKTTTVWQFVGHKLAELKHVTRSVRRKRLLEACQRGNVADAAAQLALGVELDACKTLQGETPLLIAVARKDVALATVLLDYHVDVNAALPDGTTPLSLAIAMQSYELVERLLEHHASVECVDKSGFLPLHRAAQINALGLTRLLLQHGAKVDAPTRTTLRTPLMFAANAGANEVVELLLDRGADPDCEDRDGNTPLHFATHSMQYRVTFVLLTAGADPEIPNAKNETPLDVATRMRAFHLRRLLESNGVGYSEHPVAVMDRMFASDRQLMAALAQNREVIADVIIRHRIQYDNMYTLGCIVEGDGKDDDQPSSEDYFDL